MSEGIRENIIEHVRRFGTKLERVIDDVHDLKMRMTSVEEGLAGVNRRLDRVDMRLDHIERRFELTDAPH